MEYIICVDAGGTKSAASAIDTAKKTVLCSHVRGAGNLSAQPRQAQANIYEAVQACLQQTAPAAIVVGAAGVSGFGGQQAFCAGLTQQLGCPACLISDAELGLYAAFEGGDGVLCIAGTGSIVYGKQGTCVQRGGGWGHLLGDEGGGCAVALEALRAMVHCVDAGLPQPAFAQEILAQVGLEHPAQLPGFVYSATKTQLAALAPAVEHACAAQDPCAAEILARQGSLLADTVVQLCRNLQTRQPRVLPMGSVLVHCKPLAAAFAERLQQQCPGATLLPSKTEFMPQMGGYYFWNAQRSV